MHQQQKHLVCQRNSLVCTNSLPSCTICQYLSNTLPFLLALNCIINIQSTLFGFINCFALVRVLSYLSDFSYSSEFIGKGVFFDGKRYSVSQIQNMVSPSHPWSTSGTLQKPAPTFQVLPEPPKKRLCRSSQYLPPSSHPQNHYVFEGCRKTPCKNFSHLVP